MRLCTWMLGFALLIAASGCGGGGTSSDAPDPTVQYFNGICDADPVDFFLNQEPVAENIAFTETSPGFEETEPLIRDIAVREVGSTKEYWQEEFEFVRDSDYLLCALGLENFGTEFEKRVRLARFDIDRRQPNANKARIYVVHGFNRAAGFSTPDIDFQNPGNNPQIKLADIAYLTEKNVEIDAATQTFEARRAGTESVFMSTTFTFEPGKIYVIALLGIEDGVGVLAPQIKIIELASE